MAAPAKGAELTPRRLYDEGTPARGRSVPEADQVLIRLMYGISQTLQARAVCVPGGGPRGGRDGAVNLAKRLVPVPSGVHVTASNSKPSGPVAQTTKHHRG